MITQSTDAVDVRNELRILQPQDIKPADGLNIGDLRLGKDLGVNTDPQSASHFRVGPDPAVQSDVHIVVDLREKPDSPLDFASDLHPYRTARLVHSDLEVLAARQLHAEVYVSSGFISPADVTAGGTISTAIDSWSDDCVYFAVMREGVALVAARQIASSDPQLLPAMGLEGLMADEVRRIRELPPGAVVEISALARRRGAGSDDVVAVYVRMWRESLKRRHRVWVMAVDVRVFELLRARICGNAIRQIGPPQEYMGSLVMPAVIWCDELNPEQRRLAGLAGPTHVFRSLLPRLFPHPVSDPR